MRLLKVMITLSVLFLWMSTTIYAGADTDLYLDKCASCHGDYGQGAYPIDDSNCSLTLTLDEYIDCYSTIATHDSVSDCDEECVRDTIEYIYNGYTEQAVASCQVDTVDLEDAQVTYEQSCASCHGDDVYNRLGDEGEYSLDAVQDMVNYFEDIPNHGSIDGCDDTCVCQTTTYIYEVLLGGASTNNSTDGSIGDGIDDSGSSVGCFVQTIF